MQPANRLQIVRLNQQVHCLPVCIEKVEIDPSCRLLGTDSNQYIQDFARIDKESTVPVIKLFNWS